MVVQVIRGATRCFLSLVVVGAFLSGCGKVVPVKHQATAMVTDFFGIGEELARQLMGSRGHSFGLNEKLIFTSMVNLDDLHQTSKLGRVLSESLATCLFQKGYGVIEFRKLTTVLVKDRSGELALSRETARLAKQQEADAIVAGTYSLTPGSVIINVKVLSAESADVLAVAGLELQRNPTINYLLAEQGFFADAEISGKEF